MLDSTCTDVLSLPDVCHPQCIVHTSCSPCTSLMQHVLQHCAALLYICSAGMAICNRGGVAFFSARGQPHDRPLPSPYAASTACTSVHLYFWQAWRCATVGVLPEDSPTTDPRLQHDCRNQRPVQLTIRAKRHNRGLLPALLSPSADLQVRVRDGRICPCVMCMGAVCPCAMRMRLHVWNA